MPKSRPRGQSSIAKGRLPGKICIGSKTRRLGFSNAHDCLRGSVGDAPSAASLLNVFRSESGLTVIFQRGMMLVHEIVLPGNSQALKHWATAEAASASYYREGDAFSSTRIMCMVVVPMFSAAWVKGSR
jgi:hypothetical protein